ncbi:MAG TPA: LptE family protein [Bacteroidales bacterium]|nr:LptE family protein [Bacteroidales bacterium]HRZ48424.1 LptE family protein [Bacteroidales bacterium]
MKPRIILFAIVLLGICTSPGCLKIRYTTSGASIPAQATTFSVGYFQNNAPLAQPALSNRVTNALIDKISSQTRLKLVSGSGDLHFEGEITGYTTTPEAIQGNEQAAMNRLTITLNVRFFNRIDPSKDFETRFSRFQKYATTESLSVVEDRLIDQINAELVEDIFNRALVNW